MDSVANLQATVGAAMKPQTMAQVISALVKRDRSVADLCRAVARRSGEQIVRVRADYRYSTTGFQWDIAGNFDTPNPAALYSIGLNGQDPVLGNLSEVFTNIETGARQDASELFKAYKHGFTALLIDAAGVSGDNIAAAADALMKFISSSLKTGTQTIQRWGPLKNMPGLNNGFQNGGAAPIVALAATQGWQSLCELAPPVELNAGQSYSVPLNITTSLLQPGGGAIQLIPEGLGWESLVLAVQHTFYGRTITGISG